MARGMFTFSMDGEAETVSKAHAAFLLARNCLVEFIGCMIFVFIGSLSGGSGGGIVAIAFAHGFTIFILVASMGHISGGHFNPAVSLGVFISGNLGLIATVLYMISQLTGGFIGSLLFRGITASNTTAYDLMGGGNTMPSETYNAGSWVLCEMMLTYLLVSTVLNAAVDKEGNNPLAPLAIGSCVLVDILAGGTVSGASMNPARSLGPAICYSMFHSGKSVSTSTVWSQHWIYWVGPFAGATIAALVYRSTLAEGKHRWLGRDTSGSAQIHPVEK